MSEEFDEVTGELTPEVDKTTKNENDGDDNKLKTAIAQKEHFRKKYEDLQKEIDSLKNNSKQPESKTESTSNDDLLWKQQIEFTVVHRELDSEDVKEVVDYARAKKISPDEALKTPVISAYLKEKSEKIKADRAEGVGGSRSAKGGSKSIPTFKTPEEHEKWAKEQMGLH